MGDASGLEGSRTNEISSVLACALGIIRFMDFELGSLIREPGRTSVASYDEFEPQFSNGEISTNHDISTYAKVREQRIIAWFVSERQRISPVYIQMIRHET